MPAGELGGGTDPCGVLEIARDEFLFICHMQPRSLSVRVGDAVAAGAAIGRVGQSGNTRAHIHLHLQTTSEVVIGEGLPLYYHDYRVDGQAVERGMPTGGVTGGQIVDHVGTTTSSS